MSVLIAYQLRGLISLIQELHYSFLLTFWQRNPETKANFLYYLHRWNRLHITPGEGGLNYTDDVHLITKNIQDYERLSVIEKWNYSAVILCYIYSFRYSSSILIWHIILLHKAKSAQSPARCTSDQTNALFVTSNRLSVNPSRHLHSATHPWLPVWTARTVLAKKDAV